MELSRLSVVVWHEVEETRNCLIRTVESLGCRVLATGTNGLALETFVDGNSDVGLIMCGLTLEGIDAVESLLEITAKRPIPAIVATDEKSISAVQKALEDHVMAYLVEPVRESEVRPTIYLVLKRFEQFQMLQEEVDDLKSKLEDRKHIERAKGVIMRRSDVNEDEAYRRLRRMAMDQRIKLVEAAYKILDAEVALEGVPSREMSESRSE